jgi:O-antigen/teichoic acid export membrane protein
MPVDLIDRADAPASAQDVPAPRAPQADKPAGADNAASAEHVAASTTHRVIRGALILLSTQPATWAASLLLVVFVPRLLDSRALGEYQMAVSLEGVLIALLSLGVPSVLTRRIAALPKRAATDVATALVLLVGLGTLGSALVLLVVPATGLLPISTPLMAVVLVTMVLTQFQTVLHAALTGFQRMAGYASSNAVTAVSTSLLALLFIGLGGGNLGFAGAGLIPLFFVTTMFWRRLGIGFVRAGASTSALLGMAGLGLPFLGWDILVRLRTEGEALALGAILSVEAVGWWAAAMRVVAIPVFVPTLIVTPLMPALSQIVDRREAFAQTVRRSYELTLIVTMGASAGIFAFAPIAPTVLGWAPEYQATVPLMRVLVCFFPLLSMGMVYGAALVALGKERQLLVANVAATVVQYALVFALVPVTDGWLGNGTIGAALGRVSSEVVMLAFAWMILPRGIMTFGTWLFAGRVLLAGAILVGMVSLTLPLAGWLWPLAAVTGGLAYVAALFVLRTVTPSDVRLGIGWVSERLGGHR